MLNHNLNYQTAYDFLEVFIINGHIWQDETNPNINAYKQMCFNVLKLFLNDERFLKFNQLQVAAGIVYYVRGNLNCSGDHWPEGLEKFYNITLKEVEDVTEVIKG